MTARRAAFPTRQVPPRHGRPEGDASRPTSCRLTPRFLAAELALVDAIITEVVGGTAKVTRTAAVVAALRVAVKQGIAPTD